MAKYTHFNKKEKQRGDSMYGVEGGELDERKKI